MATLGVDEKIDWQDNNPGQPYKVHGTNTSNRLRPEDAVSAILWQNPGDKKDDGGLSLHRDLLD